MMNFKIEREFATGRGTITWVFPSPMKGSSQKWNCFRSDLLLTGEIIGFDFCSTILSVKKDTQWGDGKK